MPTQDFYTPGDKAIQGGIIPELESERGKIRAAFQAVRDEIDVIAPGGGEFVEHTVDFKDQAAAPPQIRTYGSTSGRTAIAGFATFGFGTAPTALVDVLVGGVSILTAPVPAGPPGLPVPLVFVALPVASFGAKIDYVLVDGGGAAVDCNVNVLWQKTD